MTETEVKNELKTATGNRKRDLWRHLKRLRRRARLEGNGQD